MATSDDRTESVRSGATRQDERQNEIRLDDEHRDRNHDRDHDKDHDRDHRSGGAAMAGRDTHTDREVREREVVSDRTRGGVSFWSVLSGVLVAFGAFIVLSALIGGILAATGIAEGGIQASEATTAGLAAGIGLVIAQFLAYLWGGYTAGRMDRGSGFLNGLLVPIVAVVLVAILGGIVAALTGTTPDAAAAEAQRLPLPLSNLAELGTGIGIAALVAMFLGGLVGGKMGSRWHTKLEDGRTRYTR